MYVKVVVVVVVVQNFSWSGIMQHQPQKNLYESWFKVLAFILVYIRILLFLSFFFYLSCLFLVNVVDLTCFGHTLCVQD